MSCAWIFTTLQSSEPDLKLTGIGVFLVSVFGLLSPLAAFLVNFGKCIAYPPCTCTLLRVKCESKTLTTFPKFKPSNVTPGNIYLDMNDNQLTSIPANAFSNLTLSNSTDIYLDIHNNKINSVSVDAFKGIADRIVEIRIYNNSLTHIPTAFKSLRNLNSLSLRGNPILSLSSSYDIMHSLSNLTTLNIDLKGFSTWPTELNVLESLDSLHVRYLSATHLDFNAFHGLEDTLQTLIIDYSQLERIPLAVCRLQHLTRLDLTNNVNFKINGTLFEHCKNSLTDVTRLDLRWNNLRQFPDILTSFPSVSSLLLHHNQLTYISWDSVPGNMSLRDLYLEDNRLTRIPTALNKIQALRSLGLESNKIVSVEDPDLKDMVKLETLYLRNNPIEYISPDAFRNNVALRYLELSDTRISRLPLSIVGLTNLETVILNNDPIECNCDLSFLRALNVSQINFYGNCQSSSMKIEYFVTNNLQHCYDYGN